MKVIILLFSLSILSQAHASEECLSSINFELNRLNLGKNIKSPSANLSMVERDRKAMKETLARDRKALTQKIKKDVGEAKYHPYNSYQWERRGLTPPETSAEINEALEAYNAYTAKKDKMIASAWYKGEVKRLKELENVIENEVGEIWLENNSIEFNRFRFFTNKAGQSAKIFMNGEKIVAASFHSPDNNGTREFYTYNDNCGKISMYRTMENYNDRFKGKSFYANKKTCQEVLKNENHELAKKFLNQKDDYIFLCKRAKGVPNYELINPYPVILDSTYCNCKKSNGETFTINPYKRSCFSQSVPKVSSYGQVKQAISETLPLKYEWFDYGKMKFEKVKKACQRIMSNMADPKLDDMSASDYARAIKSNSMQTD